MNRRTKAKRQRGHAGVGRGGDSYPPYNDTIITKDAPLVKKPGTDSPVSLVSGANYGDLAHLLAQARQHLELARRHRRIREELEALATRKAARR